MTRLSVLMVVFVMFVSAHASVAFAQSACAAPAPVAGVRDSAAVSSWMTGTPNERGLRISRISYLNYNDLIYNESVTRPKTVSLAGFQAFEARVAGDGRPEHEVRGGYVTASFFDVLGVTLEAGRAFTPLEDTPESTSLVAVISDALWSSMFDRDPATVGQTLTVNGRRVVIVGIADRQFRGFQPAMPDALWLPGVTLPLVEDRPGLRSDDRSAGGYYQFVARLAPGATWAQVPDELASLTRWLAERYPVENDKFHTAGFHYVGPIGCTNE